MYLLPQISRGLAGKQIGSSFEVWERSEEACQLPVICGLSITWDAFGTCYGRGHSFDSVGDALSPTASGCVINEEFP